MEFHEISPLPFGGPKLTPWIFFPDIPKRNFPGPRKFFTDLPKFFPDLPTCNFLTTFRKFSQFCRSNSDFPTTFGHLSPKNVLLLPFGGSYSHGFQRLMISTKIIKSCGGGGGTYWPKLTRKIRSNSIQNCYLEHPTDNLRAKWIYLWRSSVKSSEPSQLQSR